MTPRRSPSSEQEGQGQGASPYDANITNPPREVPVGTTTTSRRRRRSVAAALAVGAAAAVSGGEGGANSAAGVGAGAGGVFGASAIVNVVAAAGFLGGALVVTGGSPLARLSPWSSSSSYNGGDGGGPPLEHLRSLRAEAEADALSDLRTPLDPLFEERGDADDEAARRRDWRVDDDATKKKKGRDVLPPPQGGSGNEGDRDGESAKPKGPKKERRGEEERTRREEESGGGEAASAASTTTGKDRDDDGDGDDNNVFAASEWCLPPASPPLDYASLCPSDAETVYKYGLFGGLTSSLSYLLKGALQAAEDGVCFVVDQTGPAGYAPLAARVDWKEEDEDEDGSRNDNHDRNSSNGSRNGDDKDKYKMTKGEDRHLKNFLGRYFEPIGLPWGGDSSHPNRERHPIAANAKTVRFRPYPEINDAEEERLAERMDASLGRSSSGSGGGVNNGNRGLQRAENVKRVLGYDGHTLEGWDNLALKKTMLRRMWRPLPRRRKSACDRLARHNITFTSSSQPSSLNDSLNDQEKEEREESRGAEGSGGGYLAMSFRRGDKTNPRHGGAFPVVSARRYVAAAERAVVTHFGGVVPIIYVATDDCGALDELRRVRAEWTFVSECDHRDDREQDAKNEDDQGKAEGDEKRTKTKGKGGRGGVGGRGGFVLRDTVRWSPARTDEHYDKFLSELIGMAEAKYWIGPSYSHVSLWVYYMRGYEKGNDSWVFVDERKKEEEEEDTVP